MYTVTLTTFLLHKLRTFQLTAAVVVRVCQVQRILRAEKVGATSSKGFLDVSYRNERVKDVPDATRSTGVRSWSLACPIGGTTVRASVNLAYLCAPVCYIAL